MRRSASGGVPELGLETLRGEVPAPPGRTRPLGDRYVNPKGDHVGGWSESRGSGKGSASLVGQPDVRSFQRVMNV